MDHGLPSGLPGRKTVVHWTLTWSKHVNTGRGAHQDPPCGLPVRAMHTPRGLELTGKPMTRNSISAAHVTVTCAQGRCTSTEPASRASARSHLPLRGTVFLPATRFLGPGGLSPSAKPMKGREQMFWVLWATQRLCPRGSAPVKLCVNRAAAGGGLGRGSPARGCRFCSCVNCSRTPRG